MNIVLKNDEMILPEIKQIKHTNINDLTIIHNKRFSRILEFQFIINTKHPNESWLEFVRLVKLVYGVSSNNYNNVQLYQDDTLITIFEPGMRLQDINVVVSCEYDKHHSGVNINIVSYLLGIGCQDCIRHRYPTELFIIRAETIHNLNENIYDYREVNYHDNKTRVSIFCNICNKYFPQTPNKHFHGRGCPKCGHTKAGLNGRNTLEDFIRISREKHGDKYNYDKVVYETNKSMVDIYCNDCHEYFPQRAVDHMSGYGCTTCGIHKRSDAKRLTTETFIERAKAIHSDKYCYDDSEYTGSNRLLLIYCKTCKDHFPQTPDGHIHMRSGCPKCALKLIGNHDGHPSIRTIPMRFYYVKLQLELTNNEYLTLYKVGVTKSTITKRFRSSQKKGLIVKSLYEEIFEPGYEAYNKEQSILNNPEYTKFRYNGSLMIRDGFGECFNSDILGFDND